MYITKLNQFQVITYFPTFWTLYCDTDFLMANMFTTTIICFVTLTLNSLALDDP